MIFIQAYGKVLRFVSMSFYPPPRGCHLKYLNSYVVSLISKMYVHPVYFHVSWLSRCIPKSDHRQDNTMSTTHNFTNHTDLHIRSLVSISKKVKRTSTRLWAPHNFFGHRWPQGRGPQVCTSTNTSPSL